MKNKILDMMKVEYDLAVEAWECAKADDDIEIMRSLSNELLLLEILTSKIERL